VMIRDDEVDSGAACGLGGSEGADAGVDADDEANTIGGSALDDIFAQVVALADAMRDMEIGSAAAEFEGGLENDDGGGAIDVVVAVDEHFFFALDSSFQAIEGRFHTGHCQRVVQMIERRGKKMCGGLWLFNPAAEEEIGEHG